MRVLVLFLRGLHLGYLGCYGNEWVQTPTIDRLAAEGIVFDQHFAVTPDAAGAEHVWQTGRYALPCTPGDAAPASAACALFPQLADHGVATFLIRDHEPEGVLPMAGWRFVKRVEGHEETAPEEALSAAFTEALAQLTPMAHWLLRIDLQMLQPPWPAPEEAPDVGDILDEEITEEPTADGDEVSADETSDNPIADLQEGYAAAVQRVDDLLGQWLEELQQRGLLEEMAVLLTTDHGQAVGEAQTRPHTRLGLHEELVHLPLILLLPSKAEAGRRISALTQSVDLLPTLAELFGVTLPAGHGQSLLPLTRGERLAVREYACMGQCRGGLREGALRTPSLAFLLPIAAPPGEALPPAELYVKPEDRWEMNDVRQHHLEFTERLEHALHRFVDATQRPGPLAIPDLPEEDELPEQGAESSESSEVPGGPVNRDPPASLP